MDLRFNVAGRISRPVGEVFEAVVNPTELSRYFTTGGARGRLAAGACVTWDFADHPGAFPVHVLEVEQDSKIVLEWASAEVAAGGDGDGATAGEGELRTTVTMTFEALDDGRTLVSISETGWRDTADGLAASYGNCQGWSQMMCAMKAYLEHGINLRDGMYA